MSTFPPEIRPLTPEQESAVEVFMDKYLEKGTLAIPHWFPQTREMSRITATKYLIARGFKEDAAAAMMRDSRAFFENTLYRDVYYPPLTPLRKFDVGALSAAFPTAAGAATPAWLGPFVREALPHYQTAIHGWDRRGHPVVYEFLGRTNPVALVELSKRYTKPGEAYTERVVRWHEHALGLAYQLAAFNHVKMSAAVGQPITSIVIVWDTTGLSYGHLWGPALEILRAVVHTDTKYFPELMHAVLVVNCPAMVRFAYAIVRPWLDSNIQKKIQFLAPGEDTREALAKYIAEDQLPAEFGGLCRCEGGCIPAPTANEKSEFSSQCATEEIDVPARNSLVREVPTLENESIAWEFVSATGNDISFGVTFINKAGEETTVLEAERLKRGEGQCSPGRGILKFVWDNHFSWMKAKTVTFRIFKI